MDKDEQVLFEVRETPIFKYIIIFLLLGWIGFAIYKFQANPIFFGSTIVGAFLIIYFTSYQRVLIATGQSLIQQQRLLIPIYKTEQVYSIKEIESLNYQSRNNKPVQDLLSLIIPEILVESSPPKIFVHMKNHQRVILEAPKYEDELNQQLIEIVKARIFQS